MASRTAPPTHQASKPARSRSRAIPSTPSGGRMEAGAELDSADMSNEAIQGYQLPVQLMIFPCATTASASTSQPEFRLSIMSLPIDNAASFVPSDGSWESYVDQYPA